MDTTLVWMDDWMASTENRLRTCSTSMTSLESSTILSTFKEIISLSPSCDQLCSMVRLMSLFLRVTGSETGHRDNVHSVVELTQLLLTHHTNLDTNIQIQEQIGQLVLQSAQLQDTWTHLVLDGVTGHILQLVTHWGLLSAQGKVWLTILHRLLMEETEEELRDSLRKEYIGLVDKLVDGLYICGDFTTQTLVVEILLRFTPISLRLASAEVWFPNYILVQTLFNSIENLKTDVRRFLLKFNCGMGDEQKVFSFEALSFQMEGDQLYKPSQFRMLWIDFNLGTNSISTVCSREQMEIEMRTVTICQSDLLQISTTSDQTGNTSVHLALSSSLQLSITPRSNESSVSAILVFPATVSIKLLHDVLGRMYGDRFVPKSKIVRQQKCSRSSLSLKLREGVKRLRKFSSSGKLEIFKNHHLKVSNISQGKQEKMSDNYLEGRKMSVTAVSLDLNRNHVEKKVICSVSNKASIAQIPIKLGQISGDLHGSVIPNTSKSLDKMSVSLGSCSMTGSSVHNTDIANSERSSMSTVDTFLVLHSSPGNRDSLKLQPPKTLSDDALKKRIEPLKVGPVNDLCLTAVQSVARVEEDCHSVLVPPSTHMDPCRNNSEDLKSFKNGDEVISEDEEFYCGINLEDGKMREKGKCKNKTSIKMSVSKLFLSLGDNSRSLSTQKTLVKCPDVSNIERAIPETTKTGVKYREDPHPTKESTEIFFSTKECLSTSLHLEGEENPYQSATSSKTTILAEISHDSEIKEMSPVTNKIEPSSQTVENIMITSPSENIIQKLPPSSETTFPPVGNEQNITFSGEDVQEISPMAKNIRDLSLLVENIPKANPAMDNIPMLSLSVESINEVAVPAAMTQKSPIIAEDIQDSLVSSVKNCTVTIHKKVDKMDDVFIVQKEQPLNDGFGQIVECVEDELDLGDRVLKHSSVGARQDWDIQTDNAHESIEKNCSEFNRSAEDPVTMQNNVSAIEPVASMRADLGIRKMNVENSRHHEGNLKSDGKASPSVRERVDKRYQRCKDIIGQKRKHSNLMDQVEEGEGSNIEDGLDRESYVSRSRVQLSESAKRVSNTMRKPGGRVQRKLFSNQSLMLNSSPDLLVSAVPNFDDVHSTSKTSGNSGKRKEYGKREKCSSSAFDDVNRTNKTPVNHKKSEDCVKRRKISIPRSNTVFRGSTRKPKVSPIPHKNENLPPLVVSRIAAPSFLSSTENDLFGMSGLELLDSDVKKNRPRKFFKSRSIPHDRKEAKKTPWRPVMPKPKKARKPTRISAYISSKCRKKDKSSRATTSQRKNLSTSDVTTSTSYRKDSSLVPIVTVDRASVCSKLDTFSIPVGGAMEREECVFVTGDAHILQHNEMLTEETDVTGLLDEAARNEVRTLEQIQLLLSWISAGMKVMQSLPGVDMQLVTEIKQMLIEIQRGL